MGKGKLGFFNENKQHCLQSLETSGSAQIEGFAQFYASKIFNNRADSDCTFVYYKEFVDQVCRSEECVGWAPAAPSQFPARWCWSVVTTKALPHRRSRPTSRIRGECLLAPLWAEALVGRRA